MAIIRSVRGSNTGFLLLLLHRAVICQKVGHRASPLFSPKVYTWSSEQTPYTGVSSAPMWMFTDSSVHTNRNNSSEKWNVCNGNVIDGWRRDSVLLSERGFVNDVVFGVFDKTADTIWRWWGCVWIGLVFIIVNSMISLPYFDGFW